MALAGSGLFRVMNGRDRLPIDAIRDTLIGGVRNNRRWGLTAPPGAGKSTRIPVWVAEAVVSLDRQVWVVQPRRLAARLLAAHVAAERGERLGEGVGVQTRFDSILSRRTRILYMTDGVAFRRFLEEGERIQAGAVIFDEFHERRLVMDAALALAIRLQKTARPDLTVGVLSATLEEDRIRRYWPDAPFWRLTGRTWPVEIRYLDKPIPSDAQSATDAAVNNLLHTWPRVFEGHALIFLPGATEIGRAVERLNGQPVLKGARVLPLHGELPPDLQLRAVAPSDFRKVIVATNVAETSLTIEGVRMVVDSGLARKSRFDPVRGVNVLEVEPISRFAAEQRAGRAGRTGPGICLRLWTEKEHGQRVEAETPEILRLDFSEIFLALRAAGLDPVRDLEWVDPPSETALVNAEKLLRDLDAFNAEASVTPIGRRMARYPTHPRWARMLVEAEKQGCLREAAWAAALAERSFRTLGVSRGFSSFSISRELPAGLESDFPALIRLWREARAVGFSSSRCRELGVHGPAAREAGETAKWFLKLGDKRGEGLAEPPEPLESDSGAIARCLLAAFPDRVARRLRSDGRDYQMAHGVPAVLDQASAVKQANWVVAAEVRVSGTGGRAGAVRMSLVTAIHPEWILDVHPFSIESEKRLTWDEKGRRVIWEEARRYRDLALESVRQPAPPSPEVSALLARELERRGLMPEEWRESFQRWRDRIRVITVHCPEEGYEVPGEREWNEGLRRLCEGAVSYAEVRERPARPVWEGMMGFDRRARLDRLAPERVELFPGRRVAVHYGEGGDPFIAVRIQDLFGVEEPPRIAKGRLILLVHILAPNQRPVQITRDLQGFWRDRYPAVKRELQRRYPRHLWR